MKYTLKKEFGMAVIKYLPCNKLLPPPIRIFITPQKFSIKN